MGVTFRSGDYIRFVRFGGRTIKDGEAAAIWDRLGVHTQVVGPKRVWLCFSTIRFLTRFKAEAHQYLVVKHRNGEDEIVKGPTSMYLNPAFHDSIEVNDGIRLESKNHCIVVSKERRYRMVGDGAAEANEINMPAKTDGHFVDHHPVKPPKEQDDQRVVCGPMVFFPEADEFVQTFFWSSPAEDLNFQKDRSKSSPFRVLHLNKDLLWKFTLPFKTSDGVRFTVTLSMTYSMESVDKCIAVEDPIANLIAGLMADTQTLGNSLNSTQIEDKKALTKWLGTTSTFEALGRAAGMCGIHIGGMQVLGIENSPDLQKKLDREKLEAANLTSQLAKKKKQEELDRLDFEQSQKKMEQAAGLKRQQARIDAEIDKECNALKLAALDRDACLQKKRLELDKLVAKQSDENVLEFLKGLKDLDVDMSKFLCTTGGREMTQTVLSKSGTLALVPVLRKANTQVSGEDKDQVKNLFEFPATDENFKL